MRILGIETSCDETATSVVEDGVKILSNVVASSSEMHAKTGGIIPEQAARQQVRSVLPVVQNAMLNAKCQMTNVDAIAVTVGPGLIGSLLVGAECAKTLAYLWKKPIIPINHLVAHIYANFIREIPNSTAKGDEVFQILNKEPEFPALALVVSGGHTDLVLMRGHGEITWLGGTRDDAAGEAFDKCARLLDLGYPGGPAISATAEKCKIPRLRQGYSGQANDKLQMFPRPMLEEDSFDFSFSGLKTAVLRENQKLDSNLQPLKPKLAAEIQEAIVDVLVIKSLRAIKHYKPKSFLLAGGVAANLRLREKFKLEIGKLRPLRGWKLKIDFRMPPLSLCTDNAACVAACAYFNNRPVDWRKIKVDPGLTIVGEL